MISINKAIVCGKIKFEPRSHQAGQSTKLSFVLETESTFTKKGGETTVIKDSVDVVVWGREAEQAAMQAAQGVWAYVEGRLKYETWKDKSGEDKGKTIVNADVVRFEGREATLFDQPKRDVSAPF